MVLVETFSCCLAFRKQARVVQQHIISLRAVLINENHWWKHHEPEYVSNRTVTLFLQYFRHRKMEEVGWIPTNFCPPLLTPPPPPTPASCRTRRNYIKKRRSRREEKASILCMHTYLGGSWCKLQYECWFFFFSHSVFILTKGVLPLFRPP